MLLRSNACLVLLAACLTIGFTPSSAWAENKTVARRPPWTSSRVHGSPQAPEPYKVVPAFPKLRFDKPTSIEELPGGERLLVTEMGGKVFTFRKDSQVGRADLVIDLIAGLTADLAERGVSLFDAEFHPNFDENHYLYLCYVHPANGGHTRVSRFTLDAASPPRALADSERVVITWPAGGHDGGCLEFGGDGFLYISTGDGSGPNPPDGLSTGQTVTDLLGAVLRIDVDRPSGDTPYRIPADNPFVDLLGARGEIWAYGLRNPWKFGIDPQTGEVFVADNGWESWEMIHRIEQGANCGWPVMEGRAVLRSEVKVGPTPIIPPVKDHPHTEANSVIGGPVYRGTKLPELAGAFIYGDYITGTIWAIRPDKELSYSCTTLVDTDQRIVAFTQASGGEIFVVDYDLTGQIYELLPSGLEDTSASFPRRLSETGIFASLESMEPSPGVVPYCVRVDRWMDGAVAQRWVAVPGDGQVSLSTDPETAATYPKGTVLIKHLTLPQDDGQAIRLETQLLHYEGGTWRPYSYLWDDTGHDATLVDATGTSRPLNSTIGVNADNRLDRTWHVNAVNECKLCHNAGPRFVLGFTLDQLDLPFAGGSGRESQLMRLAALGVLAKAPSLATDDPRRLVDPLDASQPLDDRARSYLHANCAMCHHPGGNAIVSFFLRRDLPFDRLNTNKGTGIGTFGMRDAKIIVPGDPYRSLLFYRMSKLGYARMPYVGSRVVDRAGVALIEQWIRSLPHDLGSLSAPTTDGSKQSQALQSLAAKGPAGDDPADDTIRDLVKTTEGALALAARMHRGLLAEHPFATAVGIGSAASSDVRGLFETFVAESKRRATLGAETNPAVILSLQGNAQRGKLIFFSDGARCRACHDPDDRDKSLGPTLEQIAKKFPRPAELVKHALEPSLVIDEQYAAYSVVTDEGTVHNGLVVERTDGEIVLKTVEQRTVQIARENIEEMRRSEKSLMPERILSDLTAQEAADLFEYIRLHGG
jgi:putative heme-binding domain-containing protein